MPYTLGHLWFIKRKLNAAEAVAYLERLNSKGKKIYAGLRIRGTEADPGLVQEVVDHFGEFQLCLIPAIYFKGKVCGNRRRSEVMKSFFKEHHNTLSKIPPIVVREYRSKLILLDGWARAETASSLAIPLLGYVPEKLIPLIKGLIVI